MEVDKLQVTFNELQQLWLKPMQWRTRNTSSSFTSSPHSNNNNRGQISSQLTTYLI